LYLIAGDADDITPKEQVFNAAKLVGTPASRIVRSEVPGGHIGLFMGSRALADVWPGVARWILDADRIAERPSMQATATQHVAR